MRALVTFGACVVFAVTLVWALVDTQTETPTVTIAGSVSGTCLNSDRPPTPQVSDVDGHALAGSPWISTSRGAGECTADFHILYVPAREFYKVTIGGASRVVDRSSAGSVFLPLIGAG